ncbi:MAG: GNAT family N-acetyltransferase [Actinobacteria bacterium]|nr:GNAT family N-acetyltransferase [Actinomycetota bacterium]
MNLRRADEGDAEAVAALWSEAYVATGPEGRREPYSRQEYLAVAAEADVAVALDDRGAVIGVAALFPPGSPGRSVAGPGEAEFARLAVGRAVRRQGIGDALLADATERARGLGAEAIALWSRPHQTVAHALYESRGWRRVPPRDDEDRDGRRWVFRLDL